MEVGEHLFKFAEEQRLLIGWHVAKVGQGRDELLGELLAGQCDVVLVDRDGRPHRLVQGVPLVVSAYEVVKCRKRIALPESLKDGGNLPTRLPVGDGSRMMMMRCLPWQPTMMTDWTGTAESRSAPLFTDSGVGTDGCAHR